MSGIDAFGIASFHGALMEEALRISVDSSAASYLLSSSSESRAMCTGSILSLYANSATDADNIIADLEFDCELNCVSWDLSGHCLIVTDTAGNLHLVTKDGELLFSKKFVTDGVVCGMKFAATNDDCSVQSLIVVVSNGTILHIENMLLPAVCTAAKENKGMMLSLLQKLQVQKHSFTITKEVATTDVKIRAATDSSPAIAAIAFVDSKHALWFANVTLCSSGESSSSAAQTQRACQDVCLLGSAQDELFCVALLANEYLAVIRTSDGAVLLERKLPSKSNRIVYAAQGVESCAKSLSAVLMVTNDCSCVATDAASATSQLFWLVSDGVSAQLVFVGSGALQAAGKSAGKYLVRDTGDSGSSAGALQVTEEGEVVLLQRSSSVQATVTCLLDSAVAVEALAAPSSSLEIGRNIVTDSIAWDEATFEEFVKYLNVATGATEVVGILHLLLQVAHPPAGYIRRLLHAAEVSVESLSSKQHQGVKQRCLLEILRLHHLLETADMLRLRSSRDEPDASEEQVRLSLLSLTPANVALTLREYLQRGQLRQALLVVQRCVRDALPLQLAEAVQLPPDDCVLEDFIAWVRDGVVHRLTFFNASAEGHAAPLDGVVAVAKELLKRAIVAEEKFGSPVTAVRLASLSKELLASTPSAASLACAHLIEEVRTLYGNLHLQEVIWERWDDRVRLEEVVSLGLQGLVFDRIDCTDEAALVADLRSNILPLVQDFHGDADQLLSAWINETISTRIVLAGEEEAQEGNGNDDSTCTLSRLVKVASVIVDRSVQAKIILVLLQMPVMEELSLRSGKRSDGQGPAKEPASSRHLESTRLLCELAAAASAFVSAATREALTEATRLLKVKALAASYGVGSFEPRNSKQVRSVVIIIASSVHRPESILDAIEFASSWGSTSVDMKAVLTRALIQRASNVSLFLANSVRFEDELKNVLDALPEELKRVVVEDALTFLLDDLEGVADHIAYNPSGKDCEGSDTEFKRKAEMVVRAALHLVSHFLDVVRDDSATGTADASQARRARFLEQNDCWVNSDLLANLKKILTLQTVHNVYLCLVDLSNECICREIVTELAQHRVKLLLTSIAAAPASSSAGDKRLTAENVPLDATSRKVCLLLNICPTYFTHVSMKLLVEASQTELAMEVAQALSKEKFMHSSTSAQLVTTAIDGSVTSSTDNDEGAEVEASLLLDAAVTLCAIAAKKANQISSEDYPVLPSLSLSSGVDAEMPEHLFFPIASFSLSRDLLRCSLAGCPSVFLGRTLDLLSGSETVLAVYERVEGAAAGPREGNQEIISGVLSEGVFARDGILMQASAVAMSLMKYSVGEVKRRGRHSSAELRTAQRSHKPTARATAAGGSASSGVWDQPAVDLEDLVRVLQRSENHLLATRILYSSWHNGPAKSELLKSSLLALCRKVLVYRDIDMPFAVACLAALSYDSMVRELKTAVPSIQSDFSRLQTVALVGEELSHLWDNESLLLLFQGIQTNAKWWHILSSLGMKVDLRVFQNPDAQLREKFIRSIIPELFEKCSMDLEMVTEYCRQFDLEPDCAALTYMEMLLTASPSSVSDFAWAGKVRSAAENVEERSTLQRLRDLLRRVHCLDYEKIRYVCTWIIDLLSSEEEPADMSQPEESSDDTTTSFSLRSKAQKVSTAVLQAERGVAQELQVYKRYVEIASYLVGLKFPREATESIVPAAGSASPYVYVGASYLERIPMWQLLDDPWSVLEPLLTTVPESAGKLAPLCLPLGLDKSVFNVRKILALYTRMTHTTAASVAGDDTSAGNITSLSVSQRELKAVAIQVASEAIDANLSNPLQRIELWRWIYDRESASGDDEHALVALKAALVVAQEYPTLVSSDSSIPLLSQLNREMQTLQCRCTVREFNALIRQSPRVGAKLLAIIANPTQLMRLVLDVVLETSWDLFMQGFLHLGSSVTAYSVSQHPPNHALLDFVRKAGALIDELARHGGLHLPPPTADSNAAASTTSQLELIRHNYIGKMLSDVDNNSAERDASTGAESARRAYWGAATDSTYEPSVAELRRRDDMYLAMSIAVLTLSCSTTSHRQAYETQLDSVMRGKGVRVMRRLTARSKFRAAQALFFLLAATASPATDRAELDQYKTFLFCLSELQEIRLSCAEDSLLDALGLKISEGIIGPAKGGADPRALVRTWLHDEGSHVDVVELARDLLVVTRFQDAGIWYQLVGHMSAKGLYRSLFQSMLMIECSPVFSDVCFGMLGSDVLSALVKITSDAVDRAHQVLQMTAMRSSTESTEWLFSKLSLDTVASPTASSAAASGLSSTGPGETHSSDTAHRHRVYLRAKLACRTEGWEEGAPEDLLPTFNECMRLTVSVMQAMSSRVHSKSQASVAGLRAIVPRILALLNEQDCCTCDLATVRAVGTALRTTLLGGAVSLVASGVLATAADLAGAFEVLDAKDDEILGRLLCVAGNVVDSAVMSAVLTSLLLNKGDHIVAERLRWVLRSATSTTAVRGQQRDQAVAGCGSSCLAQALVTCLERRLSVDADLACIRAVVKSLDGSTRAALVSFLRGTALGSLAQVLSGSAATQP